MLEYLKSLFGINKENIEIAPFSVSKSQLEEELALVSEVTGLPEETIRAGALLLYMWVRNMNGKGYDISAFKITDKKIKHHTIGVEGLQRYMWYPINIS